MFQRFYNIWSIFLLAGAFLLDMQITTFATNLAPGTIFITSHLLLMIGIFSTLYLSSAYAIALFSLFGLLYDIYYFEIVGLATLLFPLVVGVMYYFYRHLLFKKWTNQLLLLVVIFIFDFVAFLLGRLFGLTNLSMYIFVFYNLAPSLLFNSLLLLVLQPLLNKCYGITNKI